MHLCLKQEFDPQELWDDLNTVIWVIDTVYTRFLDLKGAWRTDIFRRNNHLKSFVAEQFQHRGIADLKLIFEWLSCGLVRFDFGASNDRK
jgi:hypothetical protein